MQRDSPFENICEADAGPISLLATSALSEHSSLSQPSLFREPDPMSRCCLPASLPACLAALFRSFIESQSDQSESERRDTAARPCITRPACRFALASVCLSIRGIGACQRQRPTPRHWTGAGRRRRRRRRHSRRRPVVPRQMKHIMFDVSCASVPSHSLAQKTSA